jgi:hypothetical protein
MIGEGETIQDEVAAKNINFYIRLSHV